MAGKLDAEIGEEALRKGTLDFVGMTRRLIADPDYPVKVAEGRFEDIAPCTGCLYCWHVRAYNGWPIRCRINPSIGREWEWETGGPEKRKKILVAGGGPSGLSAAMVAASRGHEVFVYEKGYQLGGLMALSAIVKESESDGILDMIRYFRTQLAKLKVKTVTGKEADASVVKDLGPDVVIVAVGGAPDTPRIPGIDNAKVVSNSSLHGKLKAALRFLGPKSLERLTKLWMPVGERVVIIGGALQGCQLAEFLVKRGKQVTIVDEAESMGEGLLAEDPSRLFPWLAQKGVAMFTQVRYEEITDAGLVITTKEGKRKTLEADSIMTALPLAPDSRLFDELKGMVKEVYQIGDGRQPGYMHDAIAAGADVARSV